MRFSFLMSAVLFMASSLQSIRSEEFFEGNKAYSEERYEEAVAAYEEAVEGGAIQANLFYNLGNAYYRLGQSGRAALNYKRALALKPGHAEAMANLGLVREETGAGKGKAFWQIPLSTAPVAWFTSIAGWMLFTAVCAMFLLASIWRALLMGICALAAVALVAGAAFLFLAADPTEQGIVVAPETAAYFSPTHAGKIVSPLPQALSLRILERNAEWTYVELADGRRGWVQTSTVESIFPKGKDT